MANKKQDWEIIELVRRIVTDESMSPTMREIAIRNQLPKFIPPAFRIINALSAEVVELRSVLSGIRDMAAEDIRIGEAAGTTYQIEADARAALIKSEE